MEIKNQKISTDAGENMPEDLDLKSNWDAIRGRIRESYPTLKEDDLKFMNESDMINRLHEKTGKTHAEVRQWIRSMSKII